MRFPIFTQRGYLVSLGTFEFEYLIPTERKVCIFFVCFIITDKTKSRRGGGRRCRCYERRRDKPLEKIESSHTLGGTGEVTRGEGRGEGVDTTLLSHTPKYISLIIC
jgi:hypothetical protein